MVLATYADGTSSSYQYDADSNIISSTDQNGSQFSYVYDGLNRLVDKQATQLAAGVIGSTQWTHTYDGLSRRVRSTDNNDPAVNTDDSVVEYRYNSLSQIVAERNNDSGTTRVVTALYDGENNRRRLVYPDSRQIDYSYDDINKLKSIGENGARNLR